MNIKRIYISLLLQTINIRYVKSFINESQQKIINSLIQQLFIKNFVAIKYSSLQIDKETILFVKFLSESKIYSSFLSNEEMNFKIKNSFTFSKTLILLNEENLFGSIHQLLTVNEFHSRRYVWFVWTNINKELIRINNGAYIPYHAQFLIAKNISKQNFELEEIYHPQINSTITYKRFFGKWQENKGLEITKDDFYQRRLDMNGTILAVKFDSVNHRIKWIEFIEIFCKVMNFRLDLVRGDEYEHFGEKLFPWEIFLTPSSVDLIGYDDFLLGVMWKIEYSLYIKNMTIYEDQNLLIYLRPFSINLWLAMLIICIIYTICCLFVMIKQQKFKMDENFNILNIIFNFFEAFFNQSGNEDPKSLSTRLLSITTRLTALFIVPAYSGAILSFILIPGIKLPFTDLKGLAEDGSYKVSFAKDQFFYKWFNRSRDPWAKKVNENYLVNYEDLPETAFEELQDICKLDKVAFIFIEDLTSLANCGVMKIPRPLSVAWHCLFLRNESSFKNIFNRIFKTIISSGVLDKQKKDYSSLVSVLGLRIRRPEEVNSVKIKNIASIFQLIGILYFAAILIFLFENIWKFFSA